MANELFYLACPGAPISPDNDGYGSQGVFLNRTGVRYAITAAHVFLDHNGSAIDEKALLWAWGLDSDTPERGTGSLPTLMGTVMKAAPIKVPRDGEYWDTDAALVQLADGVTCRDYYETGGPVGLAESSPFAQPAVDPAFATVDVWKSGHTTGTTHGQITRAPAQGTFPEQDGTSTRYRGLFRAQANGGTSKFADEGDSGAMVFDSANRVVGIVIAVGCDTSGHYSLVRPFDQVQAALGLT